MFNQMIPYIVGLLFGITLAWRAEKFRNHSVFYRLEASLLVSVGIAVLINATFEVVEMFESSRNIQSGAAESDSIKSIKGKSSGHVKPKKENSIIWEQTKRNPDGVIIGRRTVTRNKTGEIVPHGLATTYHPNGKVKWTANFEFGVQIGKWEEFYTSGAKEGEGIIESDGNATEKHWHENGQTKSAGSFRNGKKHGQWETWYPCGQLAERFSFLHGELNGQVRAWHANGKAKLEATFSKGRIVPPFKRWNEDGVLMAISDMSTSN